MEHIRALVRTTKQVETQLGLAREQAEFSRRTRLHLKQSREFRGDMSVLQALTLLQSSCGNSHFSSSI
uniref:Uncharacterized protein n=1 Tax=Parascaris univalens TaxID=6257 RepID=A0A915CIG1_PARUN